jgi:hypothetical protein
MKKINLLFTLVFPVVFTGCYSGADDHKNDVDPYPTYDTTNKMERINSDGTAKDSLSMKYEGSHSRSFTM